MLQEMMKLCCSESGNQDPEKLKQIMESCAKWKPCEKEPVKATKCCAQGITRGGHEQKE